MKARLSRLLSSSTLGQSNSLGHVPAAIAMIRCVVFPPDGQEQEPVLYLDPTVHALMAALMLTNQFARRVPGVAKPATESLKKLTVTNNHYRRFAVAPLGDHGGGIVAHALLERRLLLPKSAIEGAAGRYK